jgi:hypothetical protein|tara:strand:- start:3606 stop:4190 length:585 start_codon:yes stop_codon:yes gene_type:complete
MIILPDPVYNPNFQTSITSGTKLGPGISIAKFLGAPGSRIQFERISGDRNQIARNLYLQTEIMRAAINNLQFNDHRLIVAEGLYVPATNENVSQEDINNDKQTGRAVVYQLIGKNGEIDHEKTFDLAVYWKDYTNYDKLILDYDTFDPSGKLSSQIIVVVPNCPESFDISSLGEVETVFNQKLMTKNELVEFGI